MIMESNTYKPGSLAEFLKGEVARLGFSGLAAVPLGEPRLLDSLSALGKRIVSGSPDSWPDYLRESSMLRASPASAFPWAKSLLIASIPFESLPSLPADSLHLTDEPALSGLIAGYAAREDYHKHAALLMYKLAESLRKFTGIDFRHQVCVDTQPLAERPIAAWAGLGTIGRNACLLSASRQGSFLAELVLDLPLPFVMAGNSAAQNPCEKCSCCIEACLSGALKKGQEFDCGSCIAFLCSSKRGPLTAQESSLIGEWVFGCGLCTSRCPAMRMPPPVRIDLEWLLLCPSSELKNALLESPMIHPGPTLLRRNALSVLANKKTPAAQLLIEKVLSQTGSDFLRETAQSALQKSGTQRH